MLVVLTIGCWAVILDPRLAVFLLLTWRHDQHLSRPGFATTLRHHSNTHFAFDILLHQFHHSKESVAINQPSNAGSRVLERDGCRKIVH